MGMAKALRKLLDDAEIAYEVIDHSFQVTSKDIANSAHIASDRLAKSVLLHDEKGYVIAVLAGSHMIDLVKLKELTGRDPEDGQRRRNRSHLPRLRPRGDTARRRSLWAWKWLWGKTLTACPISISKQATTGCVVRVAGTDFGKLMEGAQRG